MTPDEFRFDSVLLPGDRLVFGQACSEPVGLVRALVRQGESLHAKLGRLKLFVAGSYSGLLKPEHGAWFDFASYGALGDAGALAKAGLLEIHPVPYSQLPSLIADEWRADVVLIQLSHADADGHRSLGVASDFQLAAARRARVVIAQVNARMPFLPSALMPDNLRIDHIVETDEPLIEFPPSAIDETSHRIAGHVAGLVGDGATLQMGIGNLMEAICTALKSHRDLGLHSGMLIDGMVDLMTSGVVTNARKGSHVGKSVAASVLGSRKLFEFARDNTAIWIVETHISHGAETLAKQTRFCSINSAVEVDLTGQVNAEVSGGRYVGAVGGQADFIRAAARCDGGMSIIALPSSARGGQVSRIVTRLDGPVTTARSDIDYVVTEWGVARLKGCGLRERAALMAGIAHPDHREALRGNAASSG